MRKSVYLQRRIIALSYLMLAVNILSAQENASTAQMQNDTIFRIDWIGQTPADENENKTKSSKRFFNLLIGRNSLELNKPISVIAKNPDSMWILDQGSRMIFHTKDQSGEITPIYKTKLNELSSLVGICFAPENKILFTDSRQNNIFQITQGIRELTKLNNSLALQQPTGIAYSFMKDEIWVAETAAHRISVLNYKGELIKTIGSRGTGPEEFNFPTFIWIDKKGFVYITDAMNFRVKVYDLDGELISIFGKAGDASGCFASPKGIATDSYGHIYVADALFHTIQVFDKTGKLLYYFGNQGHGKGEFWMPVGIFIDDHDFIYIADSYNSRIQVFKLVIVE
ncbi:6-bladed beta-propeller [Bacteroidota bacterium]